jgi:hypothetical protein
MSCISPTRRRTMIGSGSSSSARSRSIASMWRAASTRRFALTHQLLRRPGHVHVQADHDVVRVRGRSPGRHDPVDALRCVCAEALHAGPGAANGGRREVDCRDPPSSRREPKRLSPVPGTGVNRQAGAQVPRLGEQMRVRQRCHGMGAVA